MTRFRRLRPRTYGRPHRPLRLQLEIWNTERMPAGEAGALAQLVEEGFGVSSQPNLSYFSDVSTPVLTAQSKESAIDCEPVLATS